MIRAFKTEINPTEEQISKIHQTFGVCRFLYNLMIDANKQAHENGEKFITANEFNKFLNHEYRKDHSEHEWIWEANAKARRRSLDACEIAFKKFFKKKANFPRFKSRKNPVTSFYLISSNGPMNVDRHRIQLPSLGWMRLKEFGFVPVGQTVISVTISVEAGRYYVSALVEVPNPKPTKSKSEGIGIDVGVKVLAHDSNGNMFSKVNKIKGMKQAQRRIIREQRKVPRKIQKGEATEKRENLRKQIHKLRVAHKRVKDMRKDYHNKIAAFLVRTKPKFIVLEDLNIRGMMKNRHLSKAIQTQGLYAFRTIITNKCIEKGIPIIFADRWFPSSKLCSRCGHKHVGLKLKDRTFICPNCGYTINRDLNAAINLKNYGTSLVA